MRTLQRLKYVRPMAQATLQEVRQEQLHSARKQHRRTWWRWCSRGLAILAVIALIGGAKYLLLGRRIVLDGLVRTKQHVATARIEGRLIELACSPGQRVRAGDVLARIEPVDTPRGRRALELELEAAGFALAAFESGANLPGAELVRQLDDKVRAEHQVRIAEAEVVSSEAALQELRIERDALAVQLRSTAAATEGRIAELDGWVSVAEAKEHEIEARVDSLAFEAEVSADLAQRDLTPANEAVLDRYELEAARRGLLRQQTETQASRIALDTAREQPQLDQEFQRARLEHLRASIVTARSRIEAARRRVELWTEVAALRADLDRQAGDPEHQRAMQAELLRTRVALAENALAEHEAADAERREAALVRAAFDGVIDRVLTQAGLPVGPGTELVSYHDPAALWIDAFVPEPSLDRVGPERPCRIMGTGDRSELTGHVRALGASLVPRPTALPGPTAGLPDWRLPIEIALDDPAERSLRPNQRVKVVIPRASNRTE